MAEGEEPGATPLVIFRRDSQDGLIGDEERGEQQEGGERREGEDEVGEDKKMSCLCSKTCKIIGVILLVLLFVIAVVTFFFFCPWWNKSISSINGTELISIDTTTTTMMTPRPLITESLLRCAPSEIPSIGNVTTSHPFGTIEQTEWNDKLHFLPCMNAIGYNKALMDQFANWMEDGIWINENGTLKMKNETEGKDKFMKSFIQFAISLSGIQDGSVTVDVLIDHFKNDFDKVRCTRIIRAELPLYLPCDEADFNDSYTEKDLVPFPNSARYFMSYIQSKVLLFTVLFGEMKYTMPEVILEIKNSDFLVDFFLLASNGHRPEMIAFLDKLTFEQAKVIGISGQTILKKISVCMKELNPVSGQTWKKYYSETCLKFGDNIPWKDIHA